MEEQKTELKLIRMSDIESQEIEWLWYSLIPYGKLTIIQGDPGDGKTTLVPLKGKSMKVISSQKKRNGLRTMLLPKKSKNCLPIQSTAM